MQHTAIKTERCAYYFFQESVLIFTRHENRSDLPNSNFWYADFVKNWLGSFDSKLGQVMRKQVPSQCYCKRQIDQAVYTASCLLYNPGFQSISVTPKSSKTLSRNSDRPRSSGCSFYNSTLFLSFIYTINKRQLFAERTVVKIRKL